MCACHRSDIAYAARRGDKEEAGGRASDARAHRFHGLAAPTALRDDLRERHRGLHLHCDDGRWRRRRRAATIPAAYATQPRVNGECPTSSTGGGLGVGAVGVAAESSGAVRLTIVPPRTATRRLARCLTLSGRTAPRATAPSGRLAAWRWRRRRRRGAATTKLVPQAPPASVAAPQRQRRKIPMRRRRRRRPAQLARALACAPPWASLPISSSTWMDGAGGGWCRRSGCAGAIAIDCRMAC